MLAYPMATVDDLPEYASWGARFRAKLLDALIVVGPLFVLALVILAVVGPDDDPTTDDGAAYGALAGLAAIIAAPFYFAIMHGRPRGQTVGKRAVGIAVRRDGSLEPLGYGRAFGRAFITLVFLLIYVWILDFLWPLWDKRKQTLHDKVVGSIVVRMDD